MALWIPHCDLHSHCSHLHSCPNTEVFHVKWLSFLGSLPVCFFEVFNLMPQSFTKAGGAHGVFNISRKHKILFLYLLLSHRKTRTECKVHYTPIVPCCPEMNSGNCFQWEWTILNNRPHWHGAAVLLYGCAISSIGRKWNRESVRETKGKRQVCDAAD